MEPLVKNYTQETAVSQYRIVKAGSTDYYVAHAAANTDKLVGIADDYRLSQTAKVLAGEDVDIKMLGVGEVECGGAVSRGDLLTADSSGKAVAVTDTMVNTETIYYIGFAMADGVLNDVIEILICPGKLSKLDGITASAAEMNYNDITTLGTVQASKTVTADANKDVTGFRNVTMTGALVLGTVGSVTLGVLSSANDTSGVALSSAKTKALAVNADTGGAALTSSFVRAGVCRMLIGTAITSGADISVAGFEGLLKSIVSVNVGGNQGGVMGHYETAGTLTLTGSINTTKSGVTSFLDLGENATVAAGTVVSAYGVNPANFGTTMNGRSAIIHVTNPMAGAWGSFLDLSSATGCTQDAAAGVTGDKHLKIYLNGVLYTIAMVTA